MGSTLKISTSSRGVHGVPVIKIIQPKNLINPNPHEDTDIKDELIASFLHTPCMEQPNGLFRVDSRIDSELSDVRVTIISAIEEGQLFHSMKHATLDRLISYDNLVEINILENQFKNGDIPNGVIHKAPIDYDKFLKIKEFFDWLWAQPYNGNPVNTPIETRRDTKPKPAIIPMETIRDYFELSMEQGERMNAFENTPYSKLDKKVENIWDAVNLAFDTTKTPQGAEYWQKVINRVNG